MKYRWMLVAAFPLAIAGIGLSHPAKLTVDSAPWWTTMHTILVPLFPLLAVAIWMLLRGDRSPVAWGGRIAAIAFAAFYGGLDAVSGIATGTAVQAGEATDSAVVTALFAAGNPLGFVGAYAFFVAVILVIASAWIAGSRGWLFYVAAVGLLASAYSFTTSHIYFPRGVATLVGFAIGFALLEFVRARRATASVS